MTNTGPANNTLCVSVDMDSVASHLRGYQLDSSDDIESIYLTALPRILDVFDQCRIVATFFFVASEALNFPKYLQQALRAGHEIASHSLTHPQNFNELADDALRTELELSKQRLERELEDCEIVGFRAPSWGLDSGRLRAIAAAGYRYDASLIPSWVMPLLRYSISRRSAGAAGGRIWKDWRNAFASRVPRVEPTTAGPLLRIPVATSACLRFPYYHTLSFLMPNWLFALNGAAAGCATPCLSYVLHAVDFLALDDVRDKRIVRHPGMRISLSEKLSSVRELLNSHKQARRTAALRELL